VRLWWAVLLLIPLAAFAACQTRYDAKITYERGAERREATFTSTEPAKIMLWVGDQSREGVSGVQVTNAQEIQ
jgi:hypothetical protein